MLRDRLVCGVRNEQIQKRLLGEKDLTFAKVKELAESMEAAAKGSKQIQEKSETPAQGVYYTNKGKLGWGRSSASANRGAAATPTSWSRESNLL